jgi:hypothetical protein
MAERCPVNMRRIHRCVCCGREVRGISFFRHFKRCRQYDLEEALHRCCAAPAAQSTGRSAGVGVAA